MQNARLIPLCVLTYKEDNRVQDNCVLLSAPPTAWVAEVYSACINVPTLLMNHLGMNLNSHEGISEVFILLFFQTHAQEYIRKAMH